MIWLFYVKQFPLHDLSICNISWHFQHKDFFLSQEINIGYNFVPEYIIFVKRKLFYAIKKSIKKILSELIYGKKQLIVRLNDIVNGLHFLTMQISCYNKSIIIRRNELLSQNISPCEKFFPLWLNLLYELTTMCDS